MVVMVHTPHRDKKTRHHPQHGVAIEHGHRARARGHRPQQRRDRAGRARPRLLGGLHALSRTPRWATSAWWRSRAATARTTSSSTRAPTGACPIRWRCRRPRGSCSSAAFAREDVEAICYGNALEAYRPERADEGGGLARPGGRSISALLFEGNSVLRGQQPRVARLPRIPEARRRDGVQVRHVRHSVGQGGPATEVPKTSLRRSCDLMLPRAVYQQRLRGAATTIRCTSPSDLFASRQPGVRDALSRREADKRHRFVVFVDANVAASWPALVHDIAAYAQAHARRWNWSRRPRWCRRRAGQERSGAGDASAAAPGRTGHRSPFLRRRRSAAARCSTWSGFVAATTHRGVRHVRVPTTVLAQNDSGVGVKNGVNAFGVKNLLGSFAPPFAVLNDFDFLRTLHPRDRIAGMAEAVKVALIRDAMFFEWLEANADALRECVRQRHGAHDPPLRRAAHAPDRAGRRSVRERQRASARLRPLVRAQARGAHGARAAPRRGGGDRRRARHAAIRCRSACCRPEPKSASCAAQAARLPPVASGAGAARRSTAAG